MLLCPSGLDANGIVDQADLVSLSIAFVEALDDRAGKCGTLEAKIEPLIDCTIFYFTFPAMFRLAGIRPAASRARFLFLQMHITDGAVHPAGRQHCEGYIDMSFQ
jgi:hypothetical protein